MTQKLHRFALQCRILSIDKMEVRSALGMDQRQVINPAIRRIGAQTSITLSQTAVNVAGTEFLLRGRLAWASGCQARYVNASPAAEAILLTPSF